MIPHHEQALPHDFRLLGAAGGHDLHQASNAALVPSLGMNGAAIATMSTVIVYNLIRIGFVWKFFRIQPFAATDCWIVLLTGPWWASRHRVPCLGRVHPRRRRYAAGHFAAVRRHESTTPTRARGSTPHLDWPCSPASASACPGSPRPPDAPRCGRQPCVH
ncbi:MAG: hypothetical protein ACLR8Y_00050 [Alistipes indistinctus]